MSRLARLPRVDAVLETPPLQDLAWDRRLIKRAVVGALDDWRGRLNADKKEKLEVPDASAVGAQARAQLDRWTEVGPLPVLNATGVLLHTNLGRAPISKAAQRAMSAAAGACDVEFELDSGKRGNRFSRVLPLLRALLETEDAHVVNNGAGALLLACTALRQVGGTERRGVIISRGQMVEIGDGFRVADMAAAGGAPLIEVGSTNRTHLRDYEKALQEGAAAILWVHLSNFSQSGFVREVELGELSALARRFGVPLIADIGSGSFGRGLPPEEPTIQSYLAQGATIVTCSGDKLVGGPQAGLLAGDASTIQTCRRHPMARALRPDKTTLAALQATLVAQAGAAIPDLPLHQMVAISSEQLQARAQRICEALGWGSDRIRETVATIGGGSLPGETMSSLGIRIPLREGQKAHAVAKRLRCARPPVIGRIQDEELVLDLRSVDPVDDETLIGSLRALD